MREVSEKFSIFIFKRETYVFWIRKISIQLIDTLNWSNDITYYHDIIV